MAKTNQVPFTRTVSHRVGVVGTAGNDLESVVHVVDLGATGATGLVTVVGYVPDTAQAGANTNSRTVTLYDRGAAGAGTTKIAELALTSGVDLAAYVEKAITLQAAANLAITHGDVLAWKSLHVGTGIADPGGLLRIAYTRD